MTFWLQVFGPLVMVLGGIIGWIIRSKIEESRTIRVKLNEERRKTYSEILGPFIRSFADLKGKGPNQAINEFKSYDYKKKVFDLNLFGSDKVIRAYNNLMQYAYKLEAGGSQKPQPKEMLHLWGTLLLEIRKSLGNKKTKLNEFDMLRGMISDIEKLEYTKD